MQFSARSVEQTLPNVFGERRSIRAVPGREPGAGITACVDPAYPPVVPIAPERHRRRQRRRDGCTGAAHARAVRPVFIRVDLDLVPHCAGGRRPRELRQEERRRRSPAEVAARHGVAHREAVRRSRPRPLELPATGTRRLRPAVPLGIDRRHPPVVRVLRQRHREADRGRTRRDAAAADQRAEVVVDDSSTK